MGRKPKDHFPDLKVTELGQNEYTKRLNIRHERLERESLAEENRMTIFAHENQEGEIL